MAEALTSRGLRVVVLEQLPQVLPRTLDASLAALVETHLRQHGVDVRCGATVRAIHRDEAGDEDCARRPVQVCLEHETLPADLVLVATAHKQGRVAGENVLGGHIEYAGSLGTQAVKISTWWRPRPGWVTGMPASRDSTRSRSR